jgi:UDP-N-acetylmuramoylalanine--D-glutamate ligase
VQALGADVHEAVSPEAVLVLARAADLVVPSPGVPERHPVLVAAQSAGIPVRSEVDVAAEVATAAGGPLLLAVTGTNGKTTVTTLVAGILRAAGVEALAAGNIGTPLLDAVTAARAEGTRAVVAEVSSFQLRFTTVFRPRVGAFLNLADDHLDWHGSFAAYADAKARITAHQTADDLLVYNADDPEVARRAASSPARRVGFTIVPAAASGYRVAERDGVPMLVDGDARGIVARDRLGRAAPHDVANALAAAAVALGAAADLAVDDDAVRAAIVSVLTDFAGLPHHLEPVGEHLGVVYIDDSKATNVHAVVAAASGFPPDRVVLIAGGRNKGLDLGALRDIAPRLRAVVAIGEAAGEVEAALGDLAPVQRAGSMHDAVRLAAAMARPGDSVLLSPACASFDWYSSYAERGTDFAREVARLGSGVAS